MSELLSGFEVLEAMKEHWVKKNDTGRGKYSLAYKFVDGQVMRFDTDRPMKQDNVTISSMDINFFLKDTFSIYEEPLKVGELVKITTPHGAFVFGTIDDATHNGKKQVITVQGSGAGHYAESAVRITEEEFKVEQRKEMFRAVGRAVDEFRIGDMVEHKGVNAIVRSVQGLYVVLTGEYNGHVNAEDVIPFKFVTYVDAVAPVRIKVEPPVAPCSVAPMGLQNMSAKELF
ncbi:UNVERIFIED_ORG: hypothetical protein Xoosp15_166 [Xanthomonas phage Xoo-sp15]